MRSIHFYYFNCNPDCQDSEYTLCFEPKERNVDLLLGTQKGKKISPKKRKRCAMFKIALYGVIIFLSFPSFSMVPNRVFGSSLILLLLFFPNQILLFAMADLIDCDCCRI